MAAAAAKPPDARALFERKVALARKEYLRDRRRLLALLWRKPRKRRGPCVSRGISEQIAGGE